MSGPSQPPGGAAEPFPLPDPRPVLGRGLREHGRIREQEPSGAQQTHGHECVCVCRGTLGLSYFCAWLPWAVLAPEGPLQTLSRKHCPSPELEESLSPKPWAAPAPAPAPTDSLREHRSAPAARLLPAPCCFRQGHLRLLCCGAPGLTASPDSPSLTPSLPALPQQELGVPSSKHPGDPTGPTLAWVPFTSCPSLVSFPAVHGGQSGPLKTHTRPGRSSARPLSAPPHR